ncbi:MAG: RNHCP domain-containing protein [Patescibacteria group bacterium]
MIARKTPFTCLHCGEENPVIPANERNHCRKCLHSLHVDKATPGDRLESCKSFMEPVGIDIEKKKGYIVRHRCKACGKEKRNKAAPDDNVDLVAALILEQNHEHHRNSRR